MLHPLPPDEPALLARMARGDASALQALYDLYAKPLYSYALQVLGSRQDAEEVLQDAFTKIWQKSPTYDFQRSAPYTWCMMLLRGLCLDRVRKNGRQQRNRIVLEESGQWSELVSPASAEGVDDHQLKVLQALAGLPAPERRAIEMAVFLELPYAEISGSTGEPLGTVKSRIRRGLLRLRQTLKMP
jgi:RNA polymerase sigma-70 factor (ECF subfamily)